MWDASLTSGRSTRVRLCALVPLVAVEPGLFQSPPLSDSLHHTRLEEFSAYVKTTIEKHLANDFQLAEMRPFGEDPSEVLGFRGARRQEMVGRWLLYKWKVPSAGWDDAPSAKKGSPEMADPWWLCQVVKPLDDMRSTGNVCEKVKGMHSGTVTLAKNFQVRCARESGPDELHDHVLDTRNCLNYQPMEKPAAWTWLLLQEKQLHAAPPSGLVVKRPATTGHKGRPPKAKRAAPRTGPTSRPKPNSKGQKQ